MNGLSDPWRFSAGTKAVVSGGTKGIGASIVEELAKKGACVLTCSRSETCLAHKICSWRTEGYDVEGVVADLSTSNGRYAFADAIRTWLRGKPLDILVNNVGRHATTIYEGGEEESDEIWASNFHSMFMLTSICQEQLKRPRSDGKTSCVVNIASVVGFTSLDTNAPYPAAKAAVIKATGDWACEWGPEAIRVNCVAPWMIRSESFSPEPEKSMFEQTPLGRTGETTDVAGLVTFLCLPVAGFITGQVICVDGGYSRSEYYDQASAQTLRQKAEEISKKEDLSHLSLSRLEEVCRELGEDTAFDVDFCETHKSLFRNRKKHRTVEDVEDTNARWEKFRHRATRNVEGESTGTGSAQQERPRHKSTAKKDGLPPLSPTTSSSRPPPPPPPPPLPPPGAESSKTKNKSVTWQHRSQEFDRFQHAPLPAIDEVVESDFDKSAPVDLECVRSFRDRLRRIQEKKNARQSLRQRSKSLRCVFPSTSEGEHFDKYYVEGRESPGELPDRLEQTDSREI